MSLRTGRWKST